MTAHILSAFGAAVGTSVKECYGQRKLISEKGFGAFRLACRGICQHHMDPLNGILKRVLNRATGPELDDESYRKIMKRYTAKLIGFEQRIYYPVVLPLIDFLFSGPRQPCPERVSARTSLTKACSAKAPTAG